MKIFSNILVVLAYKIISLIWFATNVVAINCKYETERKKKNNNK